jgi:hypothetical protein
MNVRSGSLTLWPLLLLIDCASPLHMERRPAAMTSPTCQISSSSFFQKKMTASDETLFDTLVKAGVSACPLVGAADYFDRNLSKISNRSYLILVDFSRPLNVPRFSILNLTNGTVTATEVSHGLGSDPDLTGNATVFSDKDGSNMSSLGFYLTMDTYNGEYGYSLKLKGLSSTDKSAYAREIVIHPYPIGAGYNVEDCKKEKIAEGRPTSQKYCLPEGALTRGCFGLPRPLAKDIIDEIKGGVLMYVYTESP